MTIPMLYSNLAKYYDRLESQYRDYAAESKWLASLVKAEKASNVIDISCSTGRQVSGLEGELMDPTLQIVAIDSSSQMIGIAKTALRRTGCHVLQGDFLNCPFNRESFDVVICMSWSLAGLEDSEVQELLLSVHEILIPGGLFVFDVENAEGVKEHLLDKPFIDASFVDEEENCTVIRVNYSRKIEPDKVDWTAYYLFDWGSLSKLITDRMSLRFYKKSRLEATLSECGFKVESVFSSPAGEFKENSPSLYFAARRT